MSFKYKLLLAAVIMITLGVSYTLAAWQYTEAVPVPASTQEVKKEARRISGAEFEFTYYTSAQDAATIKDFYRLRLPNLGWKEKDLLRDLSQMPGSKVESPASLSGALEQNLLFEKNGSTLIVNLLPAGFSQDRQTHFSIAQGKMDLEKESATGEDFTATLLATPKKDITPTYPGASLITLSEPPQALRATYFTKDDINTVAEFYKAKMPGYGWFLVEEKPVERIDSGGYDLSKQCPNCPEDIQLQAKSIEMELTHLDFSNSSGDACKIVLSQVISKEGVDNPLRNITIILVDYAEKKE